MITATSPDDRRTQLDAGRLLQRIHLSATSRGIALQHMNQITERIDREATTGATPTFAPRYAELLPERRTAATDLPGRLPDPRGSPDTAPIRQVGDPMSRRRPGDPPGRHRGGPRRPRGTDPGRCWLRHPRVDRRQARERVSRVCSLSRSRRWLGLPLSTSANHSFRCCPGLRAPWGCSALRCSASPR